MQYPVLIAIHGVSRAGKNMTSFFVKKWVEENMGNQFAHRERGFADKLKWSLARIFYPECSMEWAIQWCDQLKSDENFTLGVILRNPDEKQTSIQKEIIMRLALRHYGTEAARDIFGDDFWVEQLLPRGDVYLRPGPSIMEADELPPLAHEHALPAPAWHQEFMVREPNPRKQTEDNRVADFCCITDMRFPNELVRVKEIPAVTVKIQNEDAMQQMIAAVERQGKEIHRSDLELPDEEFDYVLDNNDWRNAPTKLRDQVASMMERICDPLIVDG